jgi:hypothetical protein
MLCTRRERTCHGGAANQGDELATLHWIELHLLPLAKGAA